MCLQDIAPASDHAPLSLSDKVLPQLRAGDANRSPQAALHLGHSMHLEGRVHLWKSPLVVLGSPGCLALGHIDLDWRHTHGVLCAGRLGPRADRSIQRSPPTDAGGTTAQSASGPAPASPSATFTGRTRAIAA